MALLIVVEYDYAHHGIRREGVFYSLWTFSAKIGQAVAIGLSGWILSIFGYIPHAEQSDLALFGIRLLCGPVPALFFLTGILILAYYPITPEYYARLQVMILEREKAQRFQALEARGSGEA